MISFFKRLVNGLFRREPPQTGEVHREQVTQVVLTLLDAKTWGEIKRIIEANQAILLTPSSEVGELLDLLMAQAQHNNEQNQLRILKQYRQIISNCRQKGIEATFAELTESVPIQVVISTVMTFFVAKTWPEKKQILEHNRSILLTDKSQQYLLELQAEFYYDDEITNNIKQYRYLLTRCRQVGIDAAFAEVPHFTLIQLLWSFIYARTVEEKKQWLTTHAILLTEEAEQLCAQMLTTYQDDQQKILLIKPSHTLLARCRQLGIDAAFAELSQGLTMRIMSTLFMAGTWPERKKIVEENRHILLSPSGEIEQLFDELLDLYQDDEETSYRIKQYRVLLARCRQEGIDVVFAELTRATSPSDLNTPPSISESQARPDEMPIQASQDALSSLDRTHQPEQRASSQFEPTSSFDENQRVPRADHIEQAIAHHQQALQVYTRQAYPETWADIQNNLGIAYSERIRGGRAKNLEQAIYHFQQALEVYTRQTFPQKWAMSKNNLANVYSNRIRGEKAANLEQAIYYCQQALQVRARQASPEKWADSQYTLATVYSLRIRGGRAENLEQAIYHFQQALEVYTRQTFPQKWAMSKNNLANVYSQRIRGEKAANLEQAIYHLKQIFQVLTRQTSPGGWANAHHNLAIAYNNRIQGEQAANLEQAIYHNLQAGQVFTRHQFPERWARIQNNLTTVYIKRIRGERAENVEQAIYHGQQALQVYTRHEFPEQWAKTQNNLAIIYDRRIRGERAENVEQAIHHYKQALQVFTRQAFPERWAGVQLNLAFIYPYRLQGKSEENNELGISSYQQALEIYTPQAFPHICRSIAYNLGLYLSALERVASARQAFKRADQAVDNLWREAERSEAKERLAAENAQTYAFLVYNHLLTADEVPADRVAAFEYAVAGKGRAFVDTLASGGFEISAHITNNPALATDWEKFERLRQEIDTIRVALNSQDEASDKQKLRPEFQTRLSEQATLWEELTFKYPNLTATQQAPRLTGEQARQLAADLQATLIEYVQHALGWSAFVVSKETIQHVKLDAVNDKFLNDITKWIKQIENKKRVSFGERITRKRLTQLYTALIAPLQEHLPPAGSGKRLVIAPFGALHQLPLNAAQNPDTLSYLSQAYTLTFTPSLAALRAKLSGARQANWSFRAPENAVHIAYAGHEEMTSLDFLQKADQSASEMAKMFPNLKQLSEEKAILSATVTDVANRDLIHFYCHGIFEPDNPNQSGLLLHDGFLTVQRIITDLDLTHTHLTALAACQTGRVGVKQGEELVGLIQALLIAGSKSVVATLWKVDETPTQAFFQHFYRAIKAGDSPAEALSHAAQVIRKTKGWEHPYYWAAFQVSGLAINHLKSA